MVFALSLTCICIIVLKVTIDELSQAWEEARFSLGHKGMLCEQQERELNELRLLLQDTSAKVTEGPIGM